MSRQPTSTLTRLPNSGGFTRPKAEYEDELEFLEQKDDHYNDIALTPPQGRGRLYGDKGLYDFDRVQIPSHQYVPKFTSNTHARTSSRSQSRLRNASSKKRSGDRPIERTTSRYNGLGVIFTSEWTLPLFLTALTLWMWRAPSIAFFWHSAAGAASFASNLTTSAGDISGYLGSGLKHQACNIPGMATLFHCPPPVKPKNEKPVYGNKFGQTYWVIRGQYHDMINSDIFLYYENGKQVINHMRQLWILVDQERKDLLQYERSVERECKELLIIYDKLPTQMWFQSLHLSNWGVFLYHLQQSYASTTTNLTHSANAFGEMRKEVDELLKIVPEMLATERINRYDKDPGLIEDIRSYLGFPKKKEKVDIEHHDWVVNLKEIQPLLEEIHEEQRKLLEFMNVSKVLLDSDAITRQEADAGKRPVLVGLIMEEIRWTIKSGGRLYLPII